MTDETPQVPANRGGRPPRYTKALADEICERIMNGESLRGICRDDHMPDRNTVMRWAMVDEGGFFRQYAQAREIAAWNMFDDLTEIADDSRNDWVEREAGEGAMQVVANMEHIQRSRLRIDTRKWILSKVLPRTFGDKQLPSAPMTTVTVNAGD